MLLQALRIMSLPSVNSNWSYSPETQNVGRNQQFINRVTLKYDGCHMTETIEHLS